MFPDLTVRNEYGTADLVPFLRRDAGAGAGADIKVHDWEKAAAALALHRRGWNVHRISHAVSLNGDTVRDVLAGRRLLERGVNDRSEAERARRERRYAGRVLDGGRLVHPGAPHGAPSTYKNWGCQCIPCTTANSVQRRQQRANAKQKAETA